MKRYIRFFYIIIAIIFLSGCSLPQNNSISIKSQAPVSSQSNESSLSSNADINDSDKLSSQKIPDYIKNSKKIKYIDGLAYIDVNLWDFVDFLGSSYTEEINPIHLVKDGQYIKEFDNGLFLSIRVHEESDLIRSIIIGSHGNYSTYDNEKSKKYEDLLIAVAKSLDDTINEGDFITNVRASFEKAENVMSMMAKDFVINELVYLANYDGNNSGILIMPKYADYIE